MKQSVCRRSTGEKGRPNEAYVLYFEAVSSGTRNASSVSQ